MRFALYVLLIAIPWVAPVVYGPDPSSAVWVLSGLCLGSWGLARLVDQRAGQLPVSLSCVGTAWAVAAGLSALIGLAQYFGMATAFGDWVNSGKLGEAYANLRQRNHFATLTNMGLAALLWRNASVRNVFPVWATLALAALLAAGNAASGSRTGLLQLVLLVGLVWMWRDKKHPWAQSVQCRTLLAAASAYVFAALGLPLLIGLDLNNSGVLARLQDAEGSCQSRRVLWANVLHLIAQKPWFGWGWGELDYAHFITLYPGPRFCDILDNAHNLPLHLAVELGVPVALMVCGLLVWLALRQTPWREAGPARRLAWAVLALIGLHSMLEYPLWYGTFQMSVLLALFILWQTSSNGMSCGERGSVVGTAGRWLAGAALSISLLCCAYAAWDYWRISQIYASPQQRAQAYREDTLQRLQSSWLFSDYVKFAELTTTPLTGENAEHMHTLALEMLHFSPEPKVARVVIESAILLDRELEAAYYLLRFRAAFPSSWPN